MRVTLIHPCMGRRPGEPYVRTWQMEPLAPAVLAALTPKEIEVRFYDDRMERVPFDEPADLVGISVETYTAKRAYQIASIYRQRGIPVVMGGFHATLVPDEVLEYADAVVIGEAEETWPQLLADFRAGRMQRVYKASARPELKGITPDRSIFAGKRYLPIGLVETGRGCHFKCEFCAVQAFFGSKTRRPTEEVLAEIRSLNKPLIFFVDDNITSNMTEAKEFLRALIPLKIKWVSQGSIDTAHDEEFLQLLKESGCQALLIGFESLNPENLKKMHKNFNTMNGGFEPALANLRRYGIKLYPTFLIGYDEDRDGTAAETVAFAIQHKFFIAAFNHLLPFPGTPLYKRLEEQGRLLYDKWWLDEKYGYGMAPLVPLHMTSEAVRESCYAARRQFYSLGSIFRRGWDAVNCGSLFWLFYYWMINLLMRKETGQRRGYPLGDGGYDGPLVKVADAAQKGAS